MTNRPSSTGMEQAAQLIRSARRVVALTGAGISTPSGIPDYRSPKTGAWETQDPMAIASVTAFHNQPQRFYAEWLRPLATRCFEAQPNAAHLALVQLEQAGKLDVILTQNVDLLHSRAGSRNVIELHGSLANFHCPRCGKTYPGDPHYQELIENGSIPHCTACQTILKPNIVLFGDPLSQTAWLSATQYAQECDLMLVIGSSLNVGPVNLLPHFAIELGVPFIILTRSETPLDEKATLTLHDDLAEILPTIVSLALEVG